MGNTFSSAFPDIVLQAYSPREPILARDLRKLLEAMNWLHARGMVCVSQAWEDDEFSRIDAAYSGNPQAYWRVPDPGGDRSVIYGAAWVSNPGAGAGEIKVGSGVTGLTTPTTVPAGHDGWLTLGPFLLDFSSFGTDDIKMWVKGDGTDRVTVDSVMFEFRPLASPLSAGLHGDYLPFDLDEVDGDRPVSADIWRQVLADLADLLARPRLYYSWSGLEDVDLTPWPGETIPEYNDRVARAEAMAPWSNRGWTKVIPGANVTAKAYLHASNSTGSDTQVVIHHGGTSLAGDRIYKTTVTCPAGVTGWQSADLEIGEDGFVRGYDYPLASISVRPMTLPPIRETSALLNSITIWGS